MKPDLKTRHGGRILADALVAEGRLGKKSGRGFHRW